MQLNSAAIDRAMQVSPTEKYIHEVTKITKLTEIARIMTAASVGPFETGETSIASKSRDAADRFSVGQGQWCRAIIAIDAVANRTSQI